MLVLGTESHAAEQCPGRDPNTMRRMAELLSEKSAKRAGLKVIGAYMNCPAPSTPGRHDCYFIVDASSLESVSKYFTPLNLKVQQVFSVAEQIKKMGV